MEKFSKLGKKPRSKKSDENVVYKDDYIKLIEFEDWKIIKEKELVVCIIYFIELNKILLRYEYIPTFKYVDGQEYHVTVLSGGIEDGEEATTALIREIEEEAGIVIGENYQIEELKPLYMTKGHTNKYHPFILTLNERDYQEVIPKGDGSKAEDLSKSVKLDVKHINSVNASDLITEYMLLKLKEHLNI